MSASILYTPDVLGLAIELARYPLTDDLTLRGDGRSKSCGSSIVLGLALGADGVIERVGLRSHACAIGQASAAIFAGAAAGRNANEIAEAEAAIAAWLAGDAAMPEWPGLDTISAAKGYSARHGAVLLPWRAAAKAFRSLPSE